MKDEKYFANLLKELYKILSESISENLSNASNKFLSVIKSSTEDMSNDLKDKLGFKSEINFPEDLSGLFSTLEFNTENNNRRISLNNRGDGVKIRHIPSILHFFHNENNKLNTKGSIRTDTIWGYEEPENNLEGLAAFKKAEQFIEIAEEIQILLTTHSPAFYLLKDKYENSKLIHTKKDNDGTQYSYKEDNKNIYSITENNEFLALVAPFIDKEINTNKELDSLKNELLSFKKPIVLTEGKTDKTIIECAWSKLYPKEEMPFQIIASGIEQNEDERNGGAETLRRTLEFLSPILQNKVIAIFDNDKEGIERIKGLKKGSLKILNWIKIF